MMPTSIQDGLTDSNQGMSLTTIAIIIGGGVVVLSLSVFSLTYYCTRKVYRKRLRLMEANSRTAQSNTNLFQSNVGNVPVHLSQISQSNGSFIQPSSGSGPAVLSQISQSNGSLNQPNSGTISSGPAVFLPMNAYEPSNNYFPKAQAKGKDTVGLSTSSSLFSSITQNVSSQPLYIPGYDSMRLGFDFVMPETAGNLGAGATASIFGGTIINPKLAAKHGLTNIAVKVFSQAKESNDPRSSATRESFLYEVAIMNLIPANPHTVRFIGYMEQPQCAIIMKQYDGSLRDLLKDKAIGVDSNLCCKIARDTADGMKLLHDMNILHLDLKPHNILWERLPNGTLNFSICDFGYASLVGESRKIVSGLQVPKSVGITVRYTAPEMFIRLALPSSLGRKNCDLDKKIDVYAYGLSIFEALVGETFWKYLEAGDIIAKIQSGERPNLSLIRPEITASLNSKCLISIIEKCWKQIPIDRPSFADICTTLTDNTLSQ